MAQQIINTGAVANDGTGDPLRTAFTETNNNFTEIYTAGPVDSNVRIIDNTILTLNTNGNLVLAPNGTGVVQSNVNIVPNQANVRNLGSSTRRWSTVYTQYLNVTNGTTVDGDLTVGGNLTVTGNTVQIGNLVTDAKTLQLANTANTANAATGSGITVGASDNIATLLYNSTGNVWTTNIGVSAVGNVTAPYFIGNGSQLTGLPVPYGNSNVVTLLAGFGSNTISTTGNVSGGYFIGNGSTLTSIAGANVSGTVANATYATTSGSATTAGTVTTAAQGNITSVGVLTSLSATGNVTAGNVLTSAEVVASGVIQTGTGFSTGGYLSVDGSTDLHDTNIIGTLSVNTIRSDDSTVVKIQDGVEVDGDVVVNGNVTADYFIGNAAALIGLNSAGEHAANLGVSGWTELNSNVIVQVTGNANSYAQINFQNISNGTHATTDYIATAEFGTDSTYFVDMGIASGNYDATDANNSLGNSLYPQDSYLYAMGGNSVGGFGGNLVVGSNEPGGVVRVIANGSTVNDIVATFSNVGMTINGNVSAVGNIAGGNVSTGIITLTNGAVIRDTAGDAVAIGQQSGETSQGNYAVAMGFQAAITSQGIGAVAIGREAGNAQGAYAVAIGQEAGFAGQSSGAIAIGLEAGTNDQGGDSVAIGYRAGGENQDIYAVAIGYQAGNNTQGGSAVAIGEMAGTDTQGASAVAVGDGAGRITQGEYAVALGYGAGDTNQGNNSIIINATGGILNQTTANTFTVAPIRNDVANVAEVVFYNTTSKEITYGNAISVTGNISGGNIITAGNITGNTAGFAIGYRDIPQVAFTANTTIATTDAGKHFYSTQSTDYILTIANNASQGFQTGAAFTIVNQGTGNITVAQGSGVTLYLAGNASSGNRTISTFGMATCIKVATNTWFINGTGVS